MLDFLYDAEHYCGMLQESFAHWRVLLILSQGDTTFTRL